MRFHFRRIETLPRLAWCAILRRPGDVVEVLHGPWVEVADDWFCEGAWEGDFDAGEFPQATLMGSGGRLERDGIVFAAPHHTLERLHLLERGEALYVSNSLAFLLSAAGDDLDPNYPFYRRDLRSIIDGLAKYARSLPTLGGHRVQLHYHRNVRVDAAGQVREEPREPGPEFADFAAYRAFLDCTVKALCHNAADTRRRISYRPLATISTGYDSPAAAVLARGAGCNEALTFRTGRQMTTVDWGTGNDSGREIAVGLGMQVREYDRTEGLTRPGLAEAEFLAYGPAILDAVMLAWEPELAGRLLFTGFHGDKLWDLHNDKVSAEIVRGDASGATMG